MTEYNDPFDSSNYKGLSREEDNHLLLLEMKLINERNIIDTKGS